MGVEWRDVEGLGGGGDLGFQGLRVESFWFQGFRVSGI